jgi:hypothetical protein
MNTAYLMVIGPAVLGAVLGGIAYFAAGTYVNGTPGAALALFGAVAAIVGSILALRLERPLLLLDFLILLATALTAVAAWFLMQNIFAIVMVVSALALPLAASLARSQRKALT